MHFITKIFSQLRFDKCIYLSVMILSLSSRAFWFLDRVVTVCLVSSLRSVWGHVACVMTLRHVSSYHVLWPAPLFPVIIPMTNSNLPQVSIPHSVINSSLCPVPVRFEIFSDLVTLCPYEVFHV